MRIVALSGSLKADSTNSALVRAAARLADSDTEVIIYDGMGDLPHFTPDLDGDTAPASVRQWRAVVAAADALLICTPEYAYGMPGTLKNALDWLVGSGDLYHKPVAAISASPASSGGERARQWLVQTLTAQNAHIVEAASFAIPFAREKIGASGDLTDPDTIHKLQAALTLLEYSEGT